MSSRFGQLQVGRPYLRRGFSDGVDPYPGLTTDRSLFDDLRR